MNPESLAHNADTIPTHIDSMSLHGEARSPVSLIRGKIDMSAISSGR
jgi:hypothetical protein